GVTTVCLHKGLPLLNGVEEHFHPRDLERAARDFPDLNFFVYHAGFRSLQPWISGPPRSFDASTRVDWVSDLCEIRRRNPGLTAARLHGIDPNAHRDPLPHDYVSKLKAAYLDEGPRPSLTQYGWVLDR